MELNIKMEVKLQEVNTIASALKQWWSIQTWNLNSLHATPEEKLEAHRQVLVAENLLRQMGEEPPERPKNAPGVGEHSPLAASRSIKGKIGDPVDA